MSETETNTSTGFWAVKTAAGTYVVPNVSKEDAERIARGLLIESIKVSASEATSAQKVAWVDAGAPEEPLLVAASKGKVNRPPAPVKYKLGDKTWSGRGLSPRWVREYEANGNSREDLAV